MPTAQKQRQKRELKRRERRAIKLHSTSLAVGHSAPLPEPPDFGLPRFTAAEQAANPGKPMTRRVKDFLRVGEWKEGFGPDGKPVFGKYDEAELKIILNNALAMMAAGDAINLGKSHGDDQMIIPTDELISPVDEVRLHNGVLWFSTYVTPAQAEYLDNPAIKVSAGMFPDYTAGNGTVYKGRTLLHVAATDRPVVGRQGPFIALSNYVGVGQATTPAASATPAQQQQTPAAVPGQKPGTVPGQQSVKPAVKPAVRRSVVQPAGIVRARQRIANVKGRKLIRFGNNLPVLLASTLGESGTMDIAALVAAINLLLKAFGLGQLPDGTDETNIVPRLEGVAMAIGGEVVEETTETETETPEVPAVPGAPAMMANFLRQVDSRITQANKPMLDAIAELKTAVAAKAGEVVLDAKAKYIVFRNALLKAGVVEAVLAAKDKIAEKIGWDTEVLEGLSPTIKMSNLISAAGATVEPPKDESTPGVLSDAEVAERIKRRGGNPDNMPKAGAV